VIVPEIHSGGTSTPASCRSSTALIAAFALSVSNTGLDERRSTRLCERLPLAENRPRAARRRPPARAPGSLTVAGIDSVTFVGPIAAGNPMRAAVSNHIQLETACASVGSDAVSSDVVTEIDASSLESGDRTAARIGLPARLADERRRCPMSSDVNDPGAVPRSSTSCHAAYSSKRKRSQRAASDLLLVETGSHTQRGRPRSSRCSTCRTPGVEVPRCGLGPITIARDARSPARPSRLLELGQSRRPVRRRLQLRPRRPTYCVRTLPSSQARRHPWSRTSNAGLPQRSRWHDEQPEETAEQLGEMGAQSVLSTSSGLLWHHAGHIAATPARSMGVAPRQVPTA